MKLLNLMIIGGLLSFCRNEFSGFVWLLVVLLSLFLGLWSLVNVAVFH
uniref:Uncharacterized protein n=1 Tax=Rhizophora mucronata TaxID=61149 RepID=A0A2P2QD71_RHIMU